MKFYYYAVIISGIILLLNIGGLETPAGSLVRLFDMLDSNGDFTLQNFKNSALWSNSSPTDSTPGITYILVGALTAGLVLGAFGRSPDIRYITAIMVFTLSGLIVSDMIYIFIKIQSFGVGWITAAMGCAFGAALVGFFITALEFWQGTD